MQRASISGCVAPDGDAILLWGCRSHAVGSCLQEVRITTMALRCARPVPRSGAVCQTGSDIGLDCSSGSCVSFQEASAATPPTCTPGRVTPAVALAGSDCVDGAVDDLAQTPDVIQARICAPRMRSIALLLLALLALLMVSAMRHMISDTPAASAEALSNTKRTTSTSQRTSAATERRTHQQHRHHRRPPR